MNILLISQCDKRALKETRRIIDQFAERRGDRTWQTVITQDGLDTLRRLLRKTARKNTAVACHWIRGLDHSELVWVVGDRSRFNVAGATPTETTQHDILRTRDENDWHTGEAIRLLAQLAALMHDLGKSSVAFAQRLRGERIERNLYRHEWVSLRLFMAFVGQDDDAGWLARMSDPAIVADTAQWASPGRYQRDGLDGTLLAPFNLLPPLAAAIGWLILTHHRLPVYPGDPASFNIARLRLGLRAIDANWNEPRRDATPAEIAAYWDCTKGLPVHLPKWSQRASKLALRWQGLQQRNDKGGWLDNPYVMHVSRMALMLADHHYSSLEQKAPERVKGDANCPSYANTDKHGRLNQPLDEHLLGVARDAGRITHALPSFVQHLRHLRSPALRKRSGAGRFHWQDKAADAALAMREQVELNGAFIVNMASTGCGKTIANARIMHALSDPQKGLRCSFALGLRTLTLQTGRSYRDDLRLSDEDLAVRVGGSASRALFEYYEAQAERTGSASSQELIEEDAEVIYEGADNLAHQHGLLGIALKDQRIRNLLAAPMLVCTIDHLMPATEAQRAGRQIAPMLRLMSSDVVLDELDDFDLSDLPALTRLMYWIGLLGARVLISSATLPPALVQGMFEAYRHGRQQYARNRGAHYQPESPLPEVACLWVDEFAVSAAPCSEVPAFLERHTDFVARRVRALRANPPRRMGALIPLELQGKPKSREWYADFARQLRDLVLQAHGRHAENDPGTGQKISFGMVRMANIDPLFHTARALFEQGAPDGCRIHLCVYHARFPLLLRSAIENQLDQAFNRRSPDKVFGQASVRQRIDAAPDCQHVFVVLASPVSEVGRDWCLDWAIAEPSSMRSLIQLSGRVRRHRATASTESNVYIFDTNLRHLRSPEEAAFVRPGFEVIHAPPAHPHRLASHYLSELLRKDEYLVLDACPRILPRPTDQQQPRKSLVDLEHARLAATLLPKDRGAQSSRRRGPLEPLEVDAASVWQIPQATLTWSLAQQLPFRKQDGQPEATLVFLPEDGEEGDLLAHRIHEEARRQRAAVYAQEEDGRGSGRLHRLTLVTGAGIAPWGEFDLDALLTSLAEQQGLSRRKTAERFTAVSVPESVSGWVYHPVLGCVAAYAAEK